jgi:protein-S-isoprenylcysteine O-methyltransferase Ste14
VQALKLNVPPPILALLLGVAMWGVSSLEPHLAIATSFRWTAALVVALVGGTFDVLGLLAFRKSRTTIDPLRPQRASTFVTSGVYRITRNPMYVGLVFFLVAWAIFLGALWPFLGPVLFVPYVNRFQIEPEERALARLFGTDYSTYTARVRRWL